MRCPSCGQNLVPLKPAPELKTEVCRGGCGGLWMELGRVKRLPGWPAGAGRGLLAVERALGVRLFRNVEHPCPRCRTTLLHRHGFDRERQFEIDQCAKCGGYWIDPGTLARIGDRDVSGREKRETARTFFQALDGTLKGLDLAQQDTRDAAQQIWHIFRFLTPPEYLPERPPPGLNEG